MEGIFAVTFIGTKIDAIVIIGYFICILLFGSLFGRFTKSTKDFFFGGQRFSWWLIAMSCVATLVGSYSFIKYAAKGYTNGMSSSMSYLNDWFILPFFIFGWLPIIYFSRVMSIPEYFEKRFNKLARFLATCLIMLYLLGYIGFNLLTLGTALEKILGIEIYTAVIAIAVICAIYVTAGGQTAVIMTDLLQAFILLIAGFVLLFLGIKYVGGVGELWTSLPVGHKAPFSGFNQPAGFPAVGIFWQDAIANSMAFYFMNQGMIMRFLSVKSVKDGRKAIIFMVLILMPLTTLAISNVGWIGKAIPKEKLVQQEVTIEKQIAESKGIKYIPSNRTEPNPKNVFVTVTKIICMPGVFGFVMAALTAALMSTVDTLINAVAAIFVNDVWRVYIKPDREDSHYLFTARWVSIVATIVGILLVPIFRAQKSLYEAHAMFTAAITPPMVVAIIYGAFWKRYSSKAVIATLGGGIIAIAFSFIFPKAILGLEIFETPIFSWGIGPEGYKYTRAFYGLVVCMTIGAIASFIFKPDKKDITGYVCGTLKEAAEKYKQGSITSETTGEQSIGKLEIKDIQEGNVEISREAQEKIGADIGDLVYVCDGRWWLGGIRSVHLKLSKVHEDNEKIYLSKQSLNDSNLLLRKPVSVEKIL